MIKKKNKTDLNSRQRKYLRGLGHHLNHNVLVGREGITANLINSCGDSLKAHELIKIKLGRNCPQPKEEAAEQLSRQTGSHLIQLIGRTVLLYRSNPELPPDTAIHLPR